MPGLKVDIVANCFFLSQTTVVVVGELAMFLNRASYPSIHTPEK